jgi:hypothetical protein
MISKNPQAGGHGRKRERNVDGSQVSKVPKSSSERGPTSSGLGLLLIGYIPNESLDNETEDIEECSEPNFHEWSNQFVQNGDITSAFSTVYHGDEKSLGEGQHEILFCDPHLMNVDDALGCNDACHLLPMHNDTSEDEYQRPYLRGSLDVFGYGHDRLASSEPSGGN